MEILEPTLKRLQHEAQSKKENKLATLTKLALEDLDQIQRRRIGGKTLPPPPSAMVDEGVETPELQVHDTVSLEYLGDRYYKCYKLGCQPTMPPRIQHVSLDAIQKLTAHGLLCGEETWEIPSFHSRITDPINVKRKLSQFDSPFDRQFICSELNDLQHFDRLWPHSNKDDDDDDDETEKKVSGSSKPKTYRLIDDLINSICSCYIGPKTDDNTQLQVAQVLLTLFVNSSIQIHGATLLKMTQTLINMSVYATKPVLHTTPKAILTQVTNLVVSRMEECNQKLSLQSSDFTSVNKVNQESTSVDEEAEDIPQVPVDNNDVTTSLPKRANPPSLATNRGYSVLETLIQTKEQLEKDSILLLYLLCHLSLGFAPVPGDQDSTLMADSRCRAITLELILSMLNNSGRLFQSDRRFHHILQRNLCVSLSRNGISTDPVVFELGLSIFIVLFSSFRASLKSEIELLFKEIYMRLLHMQTSTYYQKSLILQAFMKIGRNPQAIVDLYLNYDCHLGSASIFENMMDLLSKIAQGRQSKPSGGSGHSRKSSTGMVIDPTTGLEVAEDKWLKLRGLRCLVTIVESLVEWGKGNINNGVTNNNNNVSDRNSLDKPNPTESPTDHNSPTPSSPTSSAKPIVSETNELISSNLPVVVNKNHLEQSGNYQPPLPHHPRRSHSQANGTKQQHNLASFADFDDEEEELSKADAPEKIQQSSTQKQLWKGCISTFNQKPELGLQQLQQHKFVSTDVGSIVSFLITNRDLSKRAIGTLMGSHEPFHIQLMHAFVDQFDFQGMPFVNALRTFLQSFRLPSEAQKIDRIMEKFADRYCETNPDAFDSAEVAYILSFSIIMLNTDQHSPQVKHRMDQAMFLKNNRGINSGKDLEETFLLAIFDDIKQSEIIMEDERSFDNSGEDPNNSSGNSTKLALYHQEAAFLQKRLVSLFQASQQHSNHNNSHNTTDNSVLYSTRYLSATHADHVKPMFAVAWYPTIAALSQVFEEIPLEIHHPQDSTGQLNSNSEIATESVALCLKGFTLAITLSSHYYLEIERNAFLSSLIKFTSIRKVDAMRWKNFEAIFCLLKISGELGEWLDEAWELVLEGLSRLEQLQMFNEQPNKPIAQSPGNSGNTNTLAQDLAILNQLRVSQPIIKGHLERLRSQSTLVLMDKIFHHSSSFSGPSILHFYRALCNVSLNEINEAKPRTYSLQKIIEITYYNMTRIRLEWTPIWNILRPYFNTMGCHTNHAIAALAVDSLRQLGMKFFDREELSQFHTQYEFLKPFEHVAKVNPSPAMQDLILQSITQMITSRANRIKSGWRSIFTVLSHLANRNPSLSVLSQAFKVCKLIFDQHLHHLGSSFVDGVNCWVSFAKNKVAHELAKEAILRIKWCAEPYLQSTSIDSTVNSASSNGKNGAEHDQEEDIFLKLFPILSGLSQILIDTQYPDLKQLTLDELFSIIDLAQVRFDDEFWVTLLRSVIIPIIDEVKLTSTNHLHHPTNIGINQWKLLLSKVIDLVNRCYPILHHNQEFMDLIMDLLISMMFFNNSNSNNSGSSGGSGMSLMQYGLDLFNNFLLSNYHQFDDIMWNRWIAVWQRISQLTLPDLLFTLITEPPTNVDDNGEEETKQPEDSEEVSNEVDIPSELIKCSLHLTLLQSLDQLLILPLPSASDKEEDSDNHDNGKLVSLLQAIPSKIARQLLQLIERSASFAHQFNLNEPVRYFLWRSGHVSQLPHLIRQETSARLLYINLGFQLYNLFGDEYGLTTDEGEWEEGWLIESICEVSWRLLDQFHELLTETPPPKPREIGNWTRLVGHIFAEVTRSPLLTSSVNDSEPSKAKYNHLISKLPLFYDQAIKLILVDRLDVRQPVQSLLVSLRSRIKF